MHRTIPYLESELIRASGNFYCRLSCSENTDEALLKSGAVSEQNASCFTSFLQKLDPDIEFFWYCQSPHHSSGTKYT